MPQLRTVGIALGALGGAVLAQAPATPVGDWPKPTIFPRENKAAATEHFRKARAYAVGDLFTDFTLRCMTDPKYRIRVEAEAYNGILEPTRVFDQLYFVGQMSVSAWALVTPGGIVLFDALNNETEAREIIVPALRKVGLDAKDIKWIVLTHGHFDHFGGASYLQRTYGAKVISSDIDWKAMEGMAPNPRRPSPPKRDITIADGQTLDFGTTPVTFYVTPGHTPGTVSTIFPVTDRGRRHMVGFYGGVGLPRAVDAMRDQIASLVRWRGITRARRVDAQIGNHALNDESLERLEQLIYRRPQDPNPYVLGTRQYQNYLGVQEECVRFALARQGFER